MIKQWIEQRVIRWIAARGYWVLKSSIPQLVVSYGTGEFEDLDDGSRLYHIYMPKGHKLSIAFYSMISRKMQ
jgi:hypothetical protein